MRLMAHAKAYNLDNILEVYYSMLSGPFCIPFPDSHSVNHPH